MQAYTYDASKGSYWITIGDHASEIAVKDDQPPLTIEKPGKTPTYMSDTGQFISNAFIFLAGLDSDEVERRVHNILSQNPSLVKNATDISHLEHIDFIASYIFKHVIQHNTCSYSLLNRCIEYLLMICRHLGKKTGGTRILSRRTQSGEHNIPRCSYKFCANTYCCQYNYPEHKKKTSGKGCFSDHYPYHKIIHDIESLSSYLSTLHDVQQTEDLVIRNNQEIIKCINTIAYVVKHMYDELWNVFISCGRNPAYEKMHQNVTV